MEEIFIDDKKPKKDPEEDILRKMYQQKMSFDNRNVSDVVKSAATKSGIDPALLFSSAFQEGMNLAISKPDEISEAYLNSGVDSNAYPVDGFYNYGLDRFGDDYNRLKKYLPEGFDQRFKTFKAKNEKGQDVTTAAFINNEDALIAKAAVMKDVESQLDNYAKKKGVTINPEDRPYFILASYNGGLGNGKTMLDEYSKAKDKRKFIDEGLTTRKGVHKNILPRLSRVKLINQLISEQTQPIQ